MVNFTIARYSEHTQNLERISFAAVELNNFTMFECGSRGQECMVLVTAKLQLAVSLI